MSYPFLHTFILKKKRQSEWIGIGDLALILKATVEEENENKEDGRRVLPQNSNRFQALGPLYSSIVRRVSLKLSSNLVRLNFLMLMCHHAKIVLWNSKKIDFTANRLYLTVILWLWAVAYLLNWHRGKSSQTTWITTSSTTFKRNQTSETFAWIHIITLI